MEAVDDDIALRLDLLDGGVPLLLDVNNLAVTKIPDAHIGDGATLDDDFVLAENAVE